MAIFIHEGDGHYLGSTIIAIADDEKSASAMIREELDKHGLKEEELDIRELSAKNGILYVDDGDY